MTVQKASVYLDYCSFYITGMDPEYIPMHADREIFASEDCITVKAEYSGDGKTHITLGSIDEMARRSGPPQFDGILNTPEHRIDISDANDLEILTMPVPDTRTRVRIWTNRAIAANRIAIAVGG